MNDFETTKQVSPLTNSELEREALRKALDECDVPQSYRYAIIDAFYKTRAALCSSSQVPDGRNEVSTEAQPEVTGAVGEIVEVQVDHDDYSLEVKLLQSLPHGTKLYPPSAIEGYAQELAKRLVREKLDEDLIQRCKEVRSWQKTGVLKENSKLQEYAERYYSGLENNLINAEADTGAQAMQLLIDLSTS